MRRQALSWRVARGTVGALSLAALAVTPVAAAQSGIWIRSAETRLVDGVYRLDASIDYQLSDAAVEALDKGVSLTIELTISVERERAYLWDETVAELNQHYFIRYHALSRMYLLKNLNSGAQRNFPSRRAALQALGRVMGLPVLDQSLLRAGERYRAYLRAALDIEALPLPLRPLAYLSSDWRMVSDWYSWRLRS